MGYLRGGNFMKDRRFETQAEIYQVLLDGKNNKKETWGIKEYIHLVGGGLIDEHGVIVTGKQIGRAHV